MRPTHSPGRPAPLSDRDPEITDPLDALDALVSDSRRLGRFWPPLTAGPEPKAVKSAAGVSVPARTQRLVAGMPEYGS